MIQELMSGNPDLKPADLENNIASTISEKIKLTDFKNLSSFEVRVSDEQKHLGFERKYFDRRIQEATIKSQNDPKNIVLLNRTGDIYLANGKASRAKNYYVKAFNLDTNNVRSATNLANTYMILGKPRQADAVYEMLDSRKHSSYILHQRAILNLLDGNFGKAKKFIKDIDKDSKNYFEAINTLGLIQLIEKKYQEAISSFLLSAKHNNRYAPAYNNLGVTYLARGNVKDAKSEFSTAIKLDPDYVEAHNNLFGLLVTSSDLKTAKEVIYKARHLIKVDNEIQFRVGWILMSVGEYEEAIKEYNKVFDFKPNNSNTLNNIGFCYAELGNIEEAVKSYEAAIKAADATSLPANNLMMLLSETGRHKTAKRLAENILARNPNDTTALTISASAFANEEDWKAAKPLILKAYKHKPPLVNLYILLGLYYSDIEPDFNKGLEALLFAIDNKIPRYELAYNNLVHIYAINGKIKEAAKYSLFIKDRGPIQDATLGLVKLMEGKINEAKQLYKRAKENVSTEFKPQIVQREYLDLALYYQQKDNLSLAKSYLEKTLKVENGLTSTSNTAAQILVDLSSE